MHRNLSSKLIRHGRDSHRRRAAAAVELAVLLPVLCYICVITIDYSRLFFMWTTISTCAFNGAMYASSAAYASSSGYSSASQAALADATNLSPTPTVSTVTTGTYTDANNNSIAYIELTVTYNFTTQFNYPGVPNAVTLSRKLRMLVSPN